MPERLRGVFTTRRYTHPRLPYLTLPYMSTIWFMVRCCSHSQIADLARPSCADSQDTDLGLSGNNVAVDRVWWGSQNTLQLIIRIKRCLQFLETSVMASRLGLQRLGLGISDRLLTTLENLKNMEISGNLFLENSGNLKYTQRISYIRCYFLWHNLKRANM